MLISQIPKCSYDYLIVICSDYIIIIHIVTFISMTKMVIQLNL